MKVYKPSWRSMALLLAIGLFLFYTFLSHIREIGEKEPFEQAYFLTLWLICAPLCFQSAVFLWISRNKGKGIYWDEEGIVIGFKGNKVYWEEIEDIRFGSGVTASIRSTKIYTHERSREKIRKRHQNIFLKTSHSLVWFLIEKPTVMHKQLLKEWETKKRRGS